ncbi:MFS transporter [Effusibacillus lacus]|uniref:MFS transporter n=1 Tax=Effusibacillus lacus TaxID=1348429 RepID=A0A292YDI6_9BACL|nr:DHA1 family multidrug resistance protein-like MFS transporter [Effusibacillus lacus]GAX90212.1 MFS transporter [Effusibacillus lacus]
MRLASLSFGRPLWVLLSGILFSHLGYYLILPLLAIILTAEKGLSAGTVGTVLGTGSIAYLSGSLLGGGLTDRLGQRRTLVLGLILRAVGLLGYGFANTLPLLFASSILTGLGGGIYTPPAKAGIATFATEQNKSTAFSFRGIAANIGITVGPLIGALLAGTSLALFIAGSLIFAGLALTHRLLLPADCANPPCETPDRRASFEILKDRPFLVFSLVTVFIWALYAQFTFSIPLRAADILPNPKSVGLLWSFTSIMIIFMQAPITRFTSTRLHPLLILAAGTVIMGIGLGSVIWSSGFYDLLLSVAIFTLGEMLVMPTVDTVVSELAEPQLIGTYFGIASLVWGLGESLGNVGGGQLINAAKAWTAPTLPWVVFAAAGGLLGLVLYGLHMWPALASPLRGALTKRSERTLSPTVSWRKKRGENK